MKKYLKYLLIFIFCLIIFCLSPISGDDWGNFLVGREGIRRSFGVALGMYFDWEGRFISRVFINIFTYHKVLWNIINSIFKRKRQPKTGCHKCVVKGSLFLSERSETAA